MNEMKGKTRGKLYIMENCRKTEDGSRVKE